MIDGLEGIIGGAGGSVVAFASSYALIQYRVKQMEKRQDATDQDLEKEIQAVNISKRSKFKEIKEDYKERIQVVHERIDRARDASEEKYNMLDQKITQGFDSINSRLDNFLKR